MSKYYTKLLSQIGSLESKLIKRDEQLKELQAYCEAQLNDPPGPPWDAYEDIAVRLVKILEGTT